MSLAADATSRLRFTGRSFMAFVLQPVPPLEAWLADVEDVAGRPGSVLTQRPVVLDLSILDPDCGQIGMMLTALAACDLRVIAVEGVDPALVDKNLAPLDPVARTAGKVIDFPGGASRPAVDNPRAAPGTTGSLLVEQPVRSGQSIVFPEGDVTVIGAVSSGAEIVAGGSIHVYGTLRGRAIAGTAGDRRSRIFCKRYEAELVAIEGCYLTAEMADPAVVGGAAEIRLEGDSIRINSDQEG